MFQGTLEITFGRVGNKFFVGTVGNNDSFRGLGNNDELRGSWKK